MTERNIVPDRILMSEIGNETILLVGVGQGGANLLGDENSPTPDIRIVYLYMTLYECT